MGKAWEFLVCSTGKCDRIGITRLCRRFLSMHMAWTSRDLFRHINITA